MPVEALGADHENGLQVRQLAAQRLDRGRILASREAIDRDHEARCGITHDIGDLRIGQPRIDAGRDQARLGRRQVADGIFRPRRQQQGDAIPLGRAAREQARRRALRELVPLGIAQPPAAIHVGILSRNVAGCGSQRCAERHAPSPDGAKRATRSTFEASSTPIFKTSPRSANLAYIRFEAGVGMPISKRLSWLPATTWISPAAGANPYSSSLVAPAM